MEKDLRGLPRERSTKEKIVEQCTDDDGSWNGLNIMVEEKSFRLQGQGLALT